MRTRIIPTLAIAFTTALGACVSAPVASGPAPVSPMRLTIVRPEYDKVLVQTNRYAYVALFEILPDRGVAIVYPATAHQASEPAAGNQWLPVSLQPNQPTYRGFPPRRVVRDHYLYAIASDVPFHISDGDYDPGTLSRELGVDAYRGQNVAATMRALAREFGPALPAQDWAEDSYALEEAQETPVVRVYCGTGDAIEVRETIVARINCSSRPPAVYGSTGGSSSGSSGGYVPPRSGPAPAANYPATAPTPTPPKNAPWAPFPHRDSVTQTGTTRPDSMRRPPVGRIGGGTSTGGDNSAHGGQGGSTQTDDHHGGNANGQGDDDHHGHGNNGNNGNNGNGQGQNHGNGSDNGRGNGGIPGNGGVNAGGNGHGNGNANGNGNNGSDNGRGNGGIPGNGGVNAGGNGNGNNGQGNGGGSSNASGNSAGNANGSHGNGQGNGTDNGRGNGGVPGNGGVNAGNGNGASNGSAGNGHGNGSNGNPSSNGNGNGNAHGNATPGIGDANPHPASPTVSSPAPRMPFGLKMPTTSRPAAQPAPAQQPSSAPAQQPKTDSAKPAPPRPRMAPVKQAPDSSDKKPKQQQ